jgi:hypothetical protein
VNFFTGFRSSNGATPAKLFRVSTMRDAGHSAVSLANSFAVEKDCDASAPAGSAAWATMLFSESIVNILLLLAACCGRDIHHSARRNIKVNLPVIIDFTDRCEKIGGRWSFFMGPDKTRTL